MGGDPRDGRIEVLLVSARSLFREALRTVLDGQDDLHVVGETPAGEEAVEAGVSGFLTKDCPLATFIDSTRAVHRGEMVLPPQMLGTLLSKLIHRRRERDEALLRLSALTPRERQVLLLLGRGLTNDGIAQELVISPETARTHVSNLLTKLQMSSRFEAASFVLRHGLLDHLTGAAR